MDAAVKSLKKGKSAGIDNIPAELVQAGGEALITTLTTICNKIWQTGEWPTPWTQSLIITLPKKGNLQMCQNCRTISLINHPSKVMLNILLNRLKPQAKEIIAEEQYIYSVCVCVYVRECVLACVRACVRACVCVCCIFCLLYFHNNLNHLIDMLATMLQTKTPSVTYFACLNPSQ